MSTDAHDLPPTSGLIAGKYQIVRLIGRGGMGSVWEGRHATLGTHVAIKFIDAEYADSQEARLRFDNEAHAAANIQSKHAIQIYDHGVTDDGKPYIVMELLQGEPLDQRIERLGRLPLQDTARILRQVARALQRAHERGIVHRDLKPENIFLVRTPDDDDEIAKVLDFGIAKFRRQDGSPGGLTSSTKTGAVLGTPFYMSPEQARGLREIDHRTDLWSLGVIAFKCVAGVLPFEGVSVGDLLVKICTSPPPVPSQVVPGLPASFDAWFARALEKEPSRRFASAQELADALAYAAGVSVKRAANVVPGSDPVAPTVPGFVPGKMSAMERLSGGSGPVGARATAAPFTAPSSDGARRSGSTRSIVFAAVGAGLIGAVIGVVGIVKFSGPKPAPEHGERGERVVASQASQASPPSTSSAASSAPHPAASASAPTASSAVEPVDTAEPPTTTAPSPGTSRPRRGGRGTKAPPAPSASAPAPSATPSTPPAEHPTTTPSPSEHPSAPPPAPTPSSPPAKPAPTTIDPGY